MSILRTTFCSHCKRSLGSLLCLALLQEVGCKVYPSASHCWDGQEHDFSGAPSVSVEDEAQP